MIKRIAFSLIFIGLLESIVYFQQSTPIIIIASICLFFLSILASVKLKIIRQIGWSGQINISILPISYVLSAAVFLVFVPEIYFLQHIYIALTAIAYYLAISLVNNICKDFDNRKSLRSCDFLITISAFLLYASIFGLYLFLKWPVWTFMLLLIIVTFVLTYEFFWYNQLFKKHIVYSLILTLIISEIAWALTLWPTGFISRAMVVFTIFYAFTNLSKHNFNKTLNRKVVRNIIVVSILALLLALITTKWTF